MLLSPFVKRTVIGTASSARPELDLLDVDAIIETIESVELDVVLGAATL